jgi:hypothetical protein
VVILASPVDLSAYRFKVEASELQVVTAPKLFIGSEGDTTVPFADTRQMFDLAREPKLLHSYPGAAHGVRLFATEHGDDLARRLIDFVTANAPPDATTALDSPTVAQGSSAGANAEQAMIQTEQAQQAWREDLNYVAERLRTQHPKAFYRVSEQEFQRAVDDLDAQIPYLTDDQVRIGLIRIAALIDGHTQIPVTQSRLGFHIYPLRLYQFSDGLFVIDAQEPYHDSVGAKIVQIGSIDVDEAYRRLATLAPHDNDMTIRLLTPLYYLIPEVLVATEVISDAAMPAFVLERGGKRSTINPVPITFDAYRNWTGGTTSGPAQQPGPRGGALVGLPQQPQPLYLSRRNERFWFTFLDDSKTLYIQYNSVLSSSQSGESLRAFSDRIAALLVDNAVRRVVLDMRHNPGGNNTTYGPLLNLLRESQPLRQPGVFFTIVGRQTFSAAMNFVTELEGSGTIFVGEPTGGSPNLYGDTGPYTLPNSRLVLQISSRYWQKSTPDDPRPWIEPQIAAALSSADYFAGRDPALDAILRHKSPATP